MKHSLHSKFIFKLFFVSFIFNSSFIILNSEFCSSQNLVTNPSFEQYDTCPDNTWQITRAVGWYNCGYSPDYYNVCDTTNFVSVPYNFCGFQYAATGNAYAGMINYYGTPINLREYFGTQLLDSLKIGHKYIASFKTSFSINQNPESCIAINKLGIKFSTTPQRVYSLIDNPTLINNFAHVYTNTIITDSLNWVTISGSFVADSSYKYIIIGNFFDDAHTDTIVYHLDSVNIDYCHAYYYVDDVSVVEDSTDNIESFNLQKTISIYPNPANDIINIDFSNSSFLNAELKIYDFLGTVITEYSLLHTHNSININFIPEGIYIVKIKTNNNYSFTQKLIITK